MRNCIKHFIVHIKLRNQASQRESAMCQLCSIHHDFPVTLYTLKSIWPMVNVWPHDRCSHQKWSHTSLLSATFDIHIAAMKWKPMGSPCFEVPCTLCSYSLIIDQFDTDAAILNDNLHSTEDTEWDKSWNAVVEFMVGHQELYKDIARDVPSMAINQLTWESTNLHKVAGLQQRFDYLENPASMTGQL